MLPVLIAMMVAGAEPPSAGDSARAPEEDIVVVGQRMKRIRVDTRRDRKTGVTRCTVRRSSGDTALDSSFCEAVLACAATETKKEGMIACMQPRLAAIAERFTKARAAAAR